MDLSLAVGMGIYGFISMGIDMFWLKPLDIACTIVTFAHAFLLAAYPLYRLQNDLKLSVNPSKPVKG